MTIRIFNPEHDIALASNIERFTAPHAGRQLRSDLCYLPALWSDDGDVVIVDDIDYAEAAYRKVRTERKPDVEFCTLEQIPHVLKGLGYDDTSKNAIASKNESLNAVASKVKIDPWGWDPAIRFQFIKAGVPEDCLPSKETIAEIRRLSGRQVTTNVLKNVRECASGKTCGESIYITDYQLFCDWLQNKLPLVVKAPWSSSGRGVRYFLKDELDANGNYKNTNALNWVANTIRQQGGVMVEPLYNKVKDFGMEFVRDTDGSVHYLGLSLFQTQNGAYTGNILASEAIKREMISKYIELFLLDEITSRLEQELTELTILLSVSPSALRLPPYGGVRGERPLFFGVDMMIVAREDGDGFLLHPCVEINLRRTMGHVALALTPMDEMKQGTMAISYESKRYHLKLKNNINVV